MRLESEVWNKVVRMNNQVDRSLNERVESLCAYIRKVNMIDVDALEKQSQDEISKVIEEGKGQAKAIRQKIVDEVRQKIDQSELERKTKADRQDKIAWLSRREELLDQVFTLLRQELPELSRSPEYAQQLPALVEEAVLAVQAKKVTLALDPESSALISEDAIQNLAQKHAIQITQSAPLEEGIGVYASSEDGRFRFDNRLLARVERKQQTLRALASKLLFEAEND